MVSGKTSVVANPERAADFSASLPGTVAACGAKASTGAPVELLGSRRRSAKPR